MGKKPKYDPTFDAPEDIIQGVDNKQEGEKFRAILNYKVLEKTKSYVILKITYGHLINTKRRF